MNHLGWLDVVGEKEFSIGVIKCPIVSTLRFYGFLRAFDFALDIGLNTAQFQHKVHFPMLSGPV
jgi:hypothetical protein